MIDVALFLLSLAGAVCAATLFVLVTGAMVADVLRWRRQRRAWRTLCRIVNEELDRAAEVAHLESAWRLPWS